MKSPIAGRFRVLVIPITGEAAWTTSPYLTREEAEFFAYHLTARHGDLYEIIEGEESAL